jgi:hypothetical protein
MPIIRSLNRTALFPFSGISLIREAAPVARPLGKRDAIAQQIAAAESRR